MALDRAASQFYCPGTNLRWDRSGQPIGAHAKAGQDWNLPLRAAIVATDGHLLFGPSFGLLAMVLTGNPWE